MTTSKKLMLEFYRSVIENKKKEIDRNYEFVEEILKELTSLVEQINHDNNVGRS